jgi:hypothetical protein
MLKVSWTGNGVAERTDLVDIEIPPGHSQVIMSLGRGTDADTSLPDLHPGDQLEVSAELEVTTDLTTDELALNRGKGCAGQPYDYPSSPPRAGSRRRAVASKSVEEMDLYWTPDSTGGRGVQAVEFRFPACRCGF